MTKEAEISYMDNVSAELVDLALNKPYSDLNRGGLFMEIGAILCLLPPPPA